MGQLGVWRSRPAEPDNPTEPVDSSAAVNGTQGLLRLGVLLAGSAVPMPALRAAAVSGSGDANFPDFESPSLRLSVSGSGDVEGPGISVGVLDAGVSGPGDITLEGCDSESADVSITGSGERDAARSVR